MAYYSVDRGWIDLLKKFAESFILNTLPLLQNRRTRHRPDGRASRPQQPCEAPRSQLPCRCAPSTAETECVEHSFRSRSTNRTLTKPSPIIPHRRHKETPHAKLKADSRLHPRQFHTDVAPRSNLVWSTHPASRALPFHGTETRRRWDWARVVSALD
ncbi:hypothetical protein BJX76DRAFT_335717 [Aspergillus varians]